MSRQPVLAQTDLPLPLYYRFHTHLRERIQRGDWAPGARLPAEPDLAREYGVSRTTVREGLSLLEREGLVERQHGRGTFVRDAREVAEWNSFYGFVPALRARGHDVTLRLIAVQVLHAGEAAAEIMERMGIAKDATLVFVKRVILADGEPFLLSTHYFPDALFPGIAQLDFSAAWITDTLDRHYGVRIVRRERWIEPIIPGEKDRRLLALLPGAPCLLIDQVSWSAGGGARPEPVYFSQAHVRGDRCRHYVQLDAK